MFVSRVDMRGGRRFQIRRGRMSMGFYLISFFGLVGRNRSVCFVGKKWPSWPSSWMILRLSFWSLLLKFHSPKEREKEWKREEAIDQPLTLSKLNKSSKVLSLSLSSLLGPSSSHFLIPPLKLSCVLLLSTLQLSSSTTTTYRRPSDPSNSLLRLLSTSLLPPPISLHEEIADKRGSSESKERHTHMCMTWHI